MKINKNERGGNKEMTFSNADLVNSSYVNILHIYSFSKGSSSILFLCVSFCKY